MRGPMLGLMNGLGEDDRRSMIVSRLIAIAVAVVVVGAFALHATSAHDGAAGVVKERMAVMKEMDKALHVLEDMLAGKRRYNADAASRALRILADGHARIPKLFPRGSHDFPSEAKPTIWTKWDDFTRLADRAATESTELQSAMIVDDRRAVRQHLRRLDSTCRRCHDEYLERDD